MPILAFQYEYIDSIIATQQNAVRIGKYCKQWTENQFYKFGREIALSRVARWFTPPSNEPNYPNDDGKLPFLSVSRSQLELNAQNTIGKLRTQC